MAYIQVKPKMDDELAKSRLAFHENMELVSVPAASETRAPTAVSRFMSTRAAWLPGSDLKRLLLPAVEDQPETVDERPAIAKRPMAAYGGHVYAQSALAACKVVEEDEKQRGVSNADGRLGLHVGILSNETVSCGSYQRRVLALTGFYP
jgi:hypothetical protein